jgi:hypothetical protein
MANPIKKTREQLQYDITCNHRLHTSVESVERFKEFHYATYIKYFSDKKEGFIYSKMNTNGSWSFRHFTNGKEALDHMNGMSLEAIRLKRNSIK